MKTLVVLGFTVFSFVSGVFADTETKDVIVIEQSKEKKKKEKPVTVESGSVPLSGSPEENIKAAYRTWEAACREWKNELKALNGKNLMLHHCGRPARREERIQSRGVYTYSSEATYKIRVVADD